MIYTRNIYGDGDVIVTLMNLNHDGDEYFVKTRDADSYRTVYSTYCYETAMSKAKALKEGTTCI